MVHLIQLISEPKSLWLQYQSFRTKYGLDLNTKDLYPESRILLNSSLKRQGSIKRKNFPDTNKSTRPTGPENNILSISLFNSSSLSYLGNYISSKQSFLSYLLRGMSFFIFSRIRMTLKKLHVDQSSLSAASREFAKK